MLRSSSLRSSLSIFHQPSQRPTSTFWSCFPRFNLLILCRPTVIQPTFCVPNPRVRSQRLVGVAKHGRTSRALQDHPAFHSKPSNCPLNRHRHQSHRLRCLDKSVRQLTSPTIFTNHSQHCNASSASTNYHKNRNIHSHDPPVRQAAPVLSGERQGLQLNEVQAVFHKRSLRFTNTSLLNHLFHHSFPQVTSLKAPPPLAHLCKIYSRLTGLKGPHVFQKTQPTQFATPSKLYVEILKAPIL